MNWTQQLISNQKEHCMINAIGSERKESPCIDFLNASSAFNC